MTTPKRIFNLITQIHPGLEAIKRDYCLIGSSALVLSGIDVEINDLDILTSRTSALILKKLWTEKLLPDYHPESPERFKSEFGRFEFDPMPVEVMGDLEVFKTENWEKVIVENKITIDVQGHSVFIPTLDEQRKIFIQLGRLKDLEKAKLIGG